MQAATLDVEGRAFTILPTEQRGNDYDALAKTCEEMGAHYDGGIKRFTLPLRCAGDMLRVGMANGLFLRPTRRVVPALRAEAESIRERAEFLASVCDGVELYPYQSEGVGYLWRNPGALLFDEMGLGKTVQALMSIEADAPALVVCPAFLKLNWQKECAKWRPDLTPVVLDEFRFPEPGELLIINYARLPETAALKGVGKPWHRTVMICDEAHYLKNGKANRTRRARVVSNRLRKVNGLIWLLTGTPLLNKPQELWSMLVLLQLHKSAYGSYGDFAKLFGGEKDSFGYVFDPDKVTEKAANILKGLALRREREQVLPDLPTKTYQDFLVPTPDDRAMMETLDSIDLELVEMALAGDKAQLQDVAFLSAGRQALAEFKAKELPPLLDTHEANGNPVVVFSAHKKPVKLIGSRKGWAHIDGDVSMKKRQEVVDAFQAGKLAGLAATVQTMSGWTLTRAHHAIFVDRTYIPGENLQAEDRICRIGQDRGCVITDVVTGHPLDAIVSSILRDKQRMIAATTGRLVEDRKAGPPAEELAQELESIADQIAGAA